MEEKEKDVQELLEDCRSDDAHRQYHAARLLKDRKVYMAVPAILPLLASTDDGVRSMAVMALGNLGYREPGAVGPAIMQMLDDADWSIRSEAAEALGFLRYHPAMGHLGRMLVDDPEWVPRCSCAEALGDLGDPGAIDLLWPGLEDEYGPVCCYTAISLGILGTPAILSRLRQQSVEHTNPRVLADLAIARYMIGGTVELGPMLDLVDAVTDADVGEEYPAILGSFHTNLWLRPPATLAADREAIANALEAMGRRAAKIAEYAAQLIALLDAQIASHSTNNV